MKDKVLLIGNGPSIFDSERGREIDDFDGKIVRCNSYEISGYEKYVGTRTDILCLGKLNLIEQLQPQYDYILLYQSGLDGGAGLRNVKAASPHNKVKFFPLTEKDKIRDLLGLSPWAEPTTGVIAIYWFVRTNIDLYLYGFDFSNIDYFSNNIANIESIRCHDSKKESVYIEFLIEQNHIKRF